MEELKYWLWLSKIKGLGSIKTQKLIKQYKTPQTIYSLNIKELMKVEGIGEKVAKEILNKKYKENLEQQVDYLYRNNIELITFKDNKYPKKLKEIYDMPICLYVKGNSEILNKFSIAVIGCRDNTKYGENVTDKLVSDLVNNNIITVSGLAKGIDSISHKVTVNKKR